MANKLDIDEELTEGRQEGKRGKGKNKLPLAVFLAVVVIAAACAAFWWYTDTTNYLKTDNAKVTADVYPITSQKEGKLLKFDAYVGKFVQSGDILGRVDGGPYIKSPSNGEFIEVDAKRGDYVMVTDVLGYVADTDNMYIGANIEETDIVKIKEGQTVKVTLDAYGSKKFSGIVTKINNITDNALSGRTTSYSTSGTYTKTTQLIPIEITLINPEIYLDEIIGTNATVKIHIRD